MNTRLLLALATLSMATLTSLMPAHAAATGSNKKGCSLRTLHGEYGDTTSGISSDGALFAEQALVTFHGDGTANAKVTVMKATSGPTRFTSNVTYTLNSDCAGSLTAARSTGETIHDDIVVTSNGAKILLLRTDPGSVVTGVEERVHW
ncbi:hypothetical protein ABZ845_19955 [Streptomyces sp. NPDC047022]|uniref:hypothetical protein n=1 Tax=Streptomyces sp. NPDC047022 TaxID=3155737 RepID=UPI0033D06E3F